MPFGTASSPSIFPIYLLPSIPFRRRRSGSSDASSSPTDSTATTPDSSPASSPSTSPPSGPSYLRGSTSHLRCSRCLADLCLTSQIISKGFTGRHGRAYLVSAPPHPSLACAQDSSNLPNTHTRKAVPRQLVTGAHTVSDISCALCGAVLGWKYVAAEEESQRYKVGKFILETKRVCRSVCWENSSDLGEADDGLEEMRMECVEDDGVEFDSQDEDECEDLFAGVWSPALARKRRKSRAFLSRKEQPEEMV